MNENQIIPYDELEIEPLDQAEVEARTPDWYATWRERIRQWIAGHAADDLAEIVLLVPDLLVLLLRLARDPRVPWTLKGQLLLAAAYVISPFDLMPEALLGVIGLTDDAGVLALVLMWLKGVTSVDHQVLRDNWSGRDDVITVIDTINTKINENADRLFSDEVWRKLRKRFARGEKRRFSLRRGQH